MLIPRSVLLLAMSAILSGAVRAQDQGTPLDPPVDYLARTPVIDGRLDAGLQRLPARKFTSFTFSNDASVPSGCMYRMGYTAGGLYLYIEADKAPLEGRDRAYQNGDGFHLMLGAPAPGDSDGTREFYVLAFSPLDSSRRGKFIWYRNVDLAFNPLRLSQMGVHTGAERTGIEVFVSWNEVYPYHPWLQTSIGFNLCFVEASGVQDKINQFVLFDRNFQSEQRPRLYRTLRFAPPPPGAAPAAYLTLRRNHLFPGETLGAMVSETGGRKRRCAVDLVVRGPDSTELFRERVFAALPGAGTPRAVEFGKLDAVPGKYVVSWSVDEGAGRGTCGLIVLPSFSQDEAKKEIDQAEGFLHPGSVTSLRFLREAAISQLARLKSYDTGEGTRGTLRELAAGLGAVKEHRDYFVERRGILRRAYRSHVDSTLQPYTVRIPQSYAPPRRFPLLVYLHGSGEDDQGHFGADTLDDGFIRLAPSGRGTSNAFTADHAQDDIREAIEDVCAAYSVDSTRIVLSGFSMGGYGVYRTFYEDPRRYAGLAVFSGSPDIGRRWIGPEEPDFQDSTLLRRFRDIPIFIYHGGRDRNCPAAQAEELVRKLRAAGAVVEFHLEPEKGHESPGPGTVKAYRRWLKSMADR